MLGREFILAVTVVVTGAMGPGVIGSDSTGAQIDAITETELFRELGGKYEVDRSEHFILAHRLGNGQARMVLDWMELTYRRVGVFCADNALPVRRVNQRMVSICISSPEDAEEASGAAGSRIEPLSGFYDLTLKRSYFDARWFAPGGETEAPPVIIKEAARVTVQHEIAHQTLHQLCPTLSERMPEWLAEGLACAFEIESDAGTAGFRRKNTWRLKDAIRCLTSTEQPAHASSGNCRAGVATRVLLNQDGASWDRPAAGVSNQRARQGDSGDASSRTPSWYAVSWAIVHYLQNERAGAFRRYVQHLAADSAAVSEREHVARFEHDFGAIDADLDARIVAALGHGE